MPRGILKVLGVALQARLDLPPQHLSALYKYYPQHVKSCLGRCVYSPVRAASTGKTAACTLGPLFMVLLQTLISWTLALFLKPVRL